MKKTIILKETTEKPILEAKPKPKEKKPISIQELYLNEMINHKHEMVVYLVNGIKLEGFLRSFDQFSYLLERNGHMQLIYKHSISTVSPKNVFALALTEFL